METKVEGGLRDHRPPAADIDPEQARAALERLIADPRFHASDRNRRFLRFVVEETLAGRQERIKSYSIAVDVFGRGADFDAAIDPIVRIEATRLRAALAAYYSDAGRDEEIQIHLPKGGYVPAFEKVGAAHSAAAGHGTAKSHILTQDEFLGTLNGKWRLLSLVMGRRPVAAAVLLLIAIAIAGVVLYVWGRTPLAAGPPLVLVETTQAAARDPSTDQIAIGFTQSLHLALSRYDGLRLVQVPRAISLSTTVDKLDSGEKIAVYALESSIRQEGQTVRFWWALKDARTGETVWTDTADRSFSKGMTITVEDEVASDVATVIGQPQGLLAMRQIGYERVQPTEGYGCVLRARAYYLEISEALHRQIRDCLEKAVAISPDYAEAWAMLAFVYLDEDRNKFNPRSTAEDAQLRALDSAKRAAELAPQSETAQEALMGVLYRKGDFDAAFAAGRRALEINPRNPQLLSSLGTRLFARGQWDEGAAMVRRSAEQALVVPPLDRVTLVFDSYRKRDFEAALEQAQLIDLPNYYAAPLLLAAINGQLRNDLEAGKNIQALLALRPQYAAEMRTDLRSRHYTEPLIDMLAEGLRKAGLKVE